MTLLRTWISKKGKDTNWDSRFHLRFKSDERLPHRGDGRCVPPGSTMRSKTMNLFMIKKCNTKISVKWWRFVEHASQKKENTPIEIQDSIYDSKVMKDYSIVVTEDVFHPAQPWDQRRWICSWSKNVILRSPLNDDAPENMYLKERKTHPLRFKIASKIQKWWKITAY